MKIYFIRHGQTNANANMTDGKLTAEIDQPLNNTGIAQAHELANQLKNVEFDIIISSPLKRAQQTAEIINQYHNLPLQTDDMWCERQVDTYIDANSWHDLFDFDKNIQIKNCESLHDFFDRVNKVIDKLKNNYDDKTVAVVSHGGVQHVLYACANNLPHKGNMRISPMRNCEYRIYDL